MPATNINYQLELLYNHQLIHLNLRMKLLALTFLCALIFSTYAYVFTPDAYNPSLQQWKNLQLKNYNYTTYDIDWITTTTITVKNGKVVKREFIYNYQNDWFPEYHHWVEDTPKELGSHDEGFVPITLDDVYTQCRQNVLIQDPLYNEVVFDTSNHGLISKCYYYPVNESDGPVRGVLIRSINY